MSAAVPRSRCWCRNTWRTLTSMGTALVLLFLLALGAMPGALLPQRSLNESKVDEYIAEHPTIGPWLDRLQFFEVFSSFWFTAIYALLFISLVGCLTPRMIEHVRSLRAMPGARPAQPGPAAQAPRRRGRRRTATRSPPRCRERLSRLAHGHPDRRRRRRDLRREGLPARVRQHRLPLLAAGPAGRGGHRQDVRLRGQRHRRSPTAGRGSARRRRRRSTRSAPATPSTAPRCTRCACASTTSRPTTCRPGRPCRSPPTSTTRPATTSTADTWRPYRLEVNHPLRVGGDRVYLQGHGYAPTFTVTFPDGQTRTQTVQWRPDDPVTLLSSGVIRIDPPGGHLPRRRRTPQAPDRHPGPVRADRATRRHAAVVELPGAERPCRRRRHLPRRHRPGHRAAAVAVLPRSAADRPGAG